MPKAFSLRNLSLGGLAFFLFSCSSPHKKPLNSLVDTWTPDTPSEGSIPRPKEKGLSRFEAFYRSSQIRNVDYELFFDITQSKEFSGRALLRFHVNNLSALNKKSLTVDFEDGTVQRLVINGYDLKENIPYNNLFLSLPTAQLREGANEVEITFTHPYGHTGTGLYRFVDPLDQRVYLFTHLEPYSANQVFPCFDQPDLKARYTLTVKAPTSFQVISATREKSQKIQGPTKTVSFPQTPRFSTYLISLHAGAYKVFSSTAGNIPLRLFVRQSLAEFVNPQEWFQLTRLGFDYFNKYFNYPYPFKKYDQVIVPDFNAGAMENVAAVTFSERFISRGQRTQSAKENLANVLLHEMAHMWFGNLVTMKWWDDLWLNESFATIMATKALSEATAFKSAWLSFALRTKATALLADHYETTHPIATSAVNTDEAFGNFDGITYGKGASALKQLIYLLGEDNFKNGVRDYFKKNAYKNTTLVDFITSLEKVSGQHLKDWTHEWIKSAGPTTVGLRYACDPRGKISKLEIRQLLSKTRNIYPQQKTLIALYNLDTAGNYKQSHLLPADFKEGLMVREARGKKCPALAYPNFGDHAYFKANLDPQTLKNVSQNMWGIADEMLRGQIWQALWYQVKEGNISSIRYAEIVLQEIPREKNSRILEQVLETLIGRNLNAPSLLQFLGDTSPSVQEFRQHFVKAFSKLAWQQYLSAAAGSDFQKIWIDAYIRSAEDSTTLHQLEKIMSGKLRLPKNLLDQDRRWLMVIQLSRFGRDQSEQLRLAELKRDKSQNGVLSALEAEAIQPQAQVKEKFMRELLGSSQLSVAKTRAIAKGLFPYEQNHFAENYLDQYFAAILDFSKTGRNPEEIEAFASYLKPISCNEVGLQKSRVFLENKQSEIILNVVKDLKENNQDGEQCLFARNVARQSL